MPPPKPRSLAGRPASFPNREDLSPLGQMLADRMMRLGLSQTDLARRLAKLRRQPWHRGLTGPISMIIQGIRPLPLDLLPRWIKALEYDPESREAAALISAANTQRVATATGGEGTVGDEAARRIRTLEWENRSLRKQLARAQRRMLTPDEPGELQEPEQLPRPDP